MSIKKLPPTILVFDSGIGGLSIYDELRKKMPHLNYIYLFDNEMFPYGDKSSDFLIDRVNQVIDEVAKKYPVDLAVIACNTASTICLPSLRAKFSFPIVGVVPAIKPASAITKNRCIGLLATKATIKRAYTTNLIQEYAHDCKVELLGLSELAIIAENKLQGKAVDMDELEQLLLPWLILAIVPDTIVLGCTHYPFIKEELAQLFPKTIFVDSGYAIASRVYNLLNTQQVMNKNAVKDSTNNNRVLSTAYNDYVEKIVIKLKGYNINNYQLIKV